VTNGPSDTPNKLFPVAARGLAYPKQNRILRRSDFRKVYDEGFRLSLACFQAFCWKDPAAQGPRLGFTATRALGKSVARNRMKRRVREALRRRLPELGAEWWLVVNVRRRALDAPFCEIEANADRVVERCKNS
jgi:ribonuclease P protein component